MAKGENSLFLYMNDLLVGKLSKQASGILSFSYDQSWLLQTGARPISLSLPLIDKEYSGTVVQNFFDNLLPDNPQIIARIHMIQHQSIDLSDSCENEWLCTQIAKAFGLPVANTDIMRFKDIKALVVERFDRKWSNDTSWLMRLPQEDCCQALGYSPHLKYEADGGPGIREIMQLLLGSRKSILDQEYFFRAQVDTVIESVSKKLPSDFPKTISEAVFQGMKKAKQQLKQSPEQVN